MKRIKLYISDEHYKILKEREETISEQLRFAILNYINTINPVSASASVQKRGDVNG